MDCQQQEAVPGEKWLKAGLAVAPLGPRARGRERLGLVAAVMLLCITEAPTSRMPPSLATSLGYQPSIYPRDKFTC